MGIDVTNKHKQTLSNALHTAVEKNFPEIVQQLIDSHFPLNETKKGGLTALITSCNDEDRFLITKLLVRAGADINIISEHGSSALSEAVNTKNHELVDILLKKGAFIYYPQEEWRDQSPFFQAIINQDVWAVETFCDHGADLNIQSRDGFSPLLYAAIKGFDEICMYLTLRTTEVDQTDKSGKNVFVMYLMKEDLIRCKQLIMRGADVNFQNDDGKTPLHFAIENQLPDSIIKFLLKAGANPHIMNKHDQDCCDIVQRQELYPRQLIFYSGECKKNPDLRIKEASPKKEEEMEEKIQRQYELKLQKTLKEHGISDVMNGLIDKFKNKDDKKQFVSLKDKIKNQDTTVQEVELEDQEETASLVESNIDETPKEEFKEEIKITEPEVDLERQPSQKS